MRWTVLGLVLALAVLASGCDKGNPNAPTVAEYEQKRQALLQRSKQGPQPGSTKTATAGAQDADGGAGLGMAAQGFRYNPVGKRDPFRSFVLDRAEELAEHERGPLEQFELNQLTVVAVVWGARRARALVEDPSGRNYVIQEGTPIGKNDGQVIRISDNSVLVRERYVDYLGDATSKEIEMRVRSTQGG